MDSEDETFTPLVVQRNESRFGADSGASTVRRPSLGGIELSIGQLIGMCVGALLVGLTIPSPLVDHPQQLRSPSSIFVPSKHRSHNEHTSKGDLPKIAWLMSFPNSGTSYTLKLGEYYLSYAMMNNLSYSCFWFR